MPVLAVLALIAAPPAFAGDDDDDWNDDDSTTTSPSSSEGTSTTGTASTGTASTSSTSTAKSSSTTTASTGTPAKGLQDAGDSEDDDWTVPTDKPGATTQPIDVDPEDDEDVPEHVQGPGEDTPSIYREATQAVIEATPDEESMSWDQYLEKYPNSLYKDRIQKRLEELTNEMYNKSYNTSGTGVDAASKELNFANALLLESIDPRTKLRTGFEWGFPDWINLYGDYEYAINRNFSVHGGLKHRYAGWNAETGARYALIKSARTNTLLTGILDFHANLTPAYPGIRPAIAFGQRLDVADGLDLQLQAGTDFDLHNGVFMIYEGGFNGTLHANQDVDVFLETSLYMRDLTQPKIGSFRFNVVTFGIKFALGKENKEGVKDSKAAVGASAPYTSNYWGYHFGSVTADYVKYL